MKTPTVRPIEIHGYALISDDNMIAAADGLHAANPAKRKGLAILPERARAIGPHRLRSPQP